MITVTMKRVNKGQPIPPEIEDELFSQCFAISEPAAWLDFDGYFGVFDFDDVGRFIKPAQARINFVAVTIDASEDEEGVISELENFGWEVILEGMADTFLTWYKKHGEAQFVVVPVWEHETEMSEGWVVASYYVLGGFEETTTNDPNEAPE